LLAIACLTGPPVQAQVTVLEVNWNPIEKNVKSLLFENILPFWFPQTIDTVYGGYNLNHDITGKPKGSLNKRLIVQARCVWFYSRLYNSGLGTEDHLKAARIGYEFLRDAMWDKQFGGFYWEVDTAGTVATMIEKHLYGQAFALYALSEYAMASKDPAVIAFARKHFGLLEYYAYDPVYGGYLESFRRDWTVPPKVGTNYMAVPNDVKLMNTHLHLMEALTCYLRASKDPVARERLVELIFIQSNAVLRKKLGACSDKYSRSWVPLRGPNYDRVSYGHDLENIWLLMDACEAAGLSNGPLADLYRKLFAYSVQFGYDNNNGGFYDSGGFNAMADKRAKVFWVQAEALVSALKMLQLTGDERYFKVFTKTLDWVQNHQADRKNGDWFSSVPEKGIPTGDKAGPWKCMYHNGRAMIECLETISEMSKP